VHEATEESLTTILYAPGSFVPMLRVEQRVKEEGEKSEKEQAMQEAMALVEGLLAEGGMELKKQHAKANELQVSFFVTDHAGTPTKLIDERGDSLWEAEPDDWAAVQNEEGARQPIRFQGQWLDEESGFYYNRHRYYDPRQGRYITQDPIGFMGGVNTYGYPVNPISNIDPKGLTALELTLAAFAVDVATPEPSDLVIWKWLGWGLAIGITALLCSGSKTETQEQSKEKKPCPPCKTVSGKIVPIGTVGYRPMDTPSKPQHGISGSHYNLLKANQNPNNCQCFWQPIGAVRPVDLPAGAMPVEPFAN
jgi:RHS repeat-associated protein